MREGPGESERYVMRFPFQVGSGNEIRGVESPVAWSVQALDFTWTGGSHLHILQASGFDTEETARASVAQVYAGLMWVALNVDIPFKASTEIGRIVHMDDPKRAAENLKRLFGVDANEVHGLGDEHLPAVFQAGKKIRFGGVGQPSVIKSTGIESILRVFNEAVSAPQAVAVVSDERFRTALDFYVSHSYEQSENARFLTLMMSLEVLAEKRLKPPKVLSLVEEWKERVAALKAESPPGSDDFDGFEALERELLFRKEASIRSRVVSTVKDILERSADPEARGQSRQAASLYDLRSTLLHEGRLPPYESSRAQSETKSLVQKVLKARFREVAGL